MSYEPNVPAVAFLMSDPTRWAILAALLDGRALPAGELAYVAGVSPQTASNHLSKLREGGLVAMEKQGRHRYFRLSGETVAHAIEQLATIQPLPAVRRKPLSPKARQLQHARTCYNHLAGRFAVALADGLEQRGFLIAMPDKQYDVTDTGVTWFASIGIDVADIQPTRRCLARQCLDWTERRHHLAGPLATELMRALVRGGWLLRASNSRAVHITPFGQAQMRHHFGGVGAAACSRRCQ